MNESDSFQRASAAALRLLSYRPRSEAEVRARLRRRFPDPIVEQVIQSLGEGSILDDAAFAKLWKDSRESFRPRSASAIRRELISKGIAKDLADAAVQDVDDEDGAYRAGLKHARQLGGADLADFRRKLWGYLKRRGFSDSVARSAIKRLWDAHLGGLQSDDAEGR